MMTLLLKYGNHILITTVVNLIVNQMKSIKERLFVSELAQTIELELDHRKFL